MALALGHHAELKSTPGLILGQAFIMGWRFDTVVSGYTNNTFGGDLLREQRPCVVFVDDEKLVCLDKEFLRVQRPKRPSSLYQWRQRALPNFAGDQTARAKDMENYANSMLQTAQWLIANRKVY